MALVESSPAYQLPQSMARSASAHSIKRRSERGAVKLVSVVFVAGVLLPSVVSASAATLCHQRRR